MRERMNESTNPVNTEKSGNLLFLNQFGACIWSFARVEKSSLKLRERKWGVFQEKTPYGNTQALWFSCSVLVLVWSSDERGDMSVSPLFCLFGRFRLFCVLFF